MKKIVLALIFAAVALCFAQDEEDAAAQIEPQIQAQQEEAQQEQIAPQAAQEQGQEQETEEKKERVVTSVFFVGLQRNNAPEIDESLERMIRTTWWQDTYIRFVPQEKTRQIRNKLFLDGEASVDDALFAELRKHGLENSVILLVSVEKFTIQPRRRRIIGAEVAGQLNARFMFFDGSTQKILLATLTPTEHAIRKTPIFFRSLKERVNVSAQDRKIIIDKLLQDTVRFGFEKMKIAISAKNNAN